MPMAITFSAKINGFNMLSSKSTHEPAPPCDLSPNKGKEYKEAEYRRLLSEPIEATKKDFAPKALKYHNV
jgi:hypothetical protein